MNSESVQRIQELEAALAANPRGLEFIELANLLADNAERRVEAREYCFRGISENPTALRGRLVLARLFYLDRYFEFAAKELVELTKYAEVPALTKLVTALGPHLKSYEPIDPTTRDRGEKVEDGEDEVLAEIDLDSEFVEILDDIEDQS